MIRPAEKRDASRIAEIIIFNYRINFFPIFRDEEFYFGEMNVVSMAQELDLQDTFVYDDGAVKGVVVMNGDEIARLFVEPCFQNGGIGAKLLDFAVGRGGSWLWALEKNERAIRFYQRHGFCLTQMRKLEEDTTEYLVRMQRT